MLLIYTDMQLDDLCALEILGGWCAKYHQKAFIVATNIKELKKYDYGSIFVKTIKDAKEYLDDWFTYGYEIVSEAALRRPARDDIEAIFVLCSCTAIFNDTKTRQWILSKKLYIMGGSSQADDGVGAEYNASRDRLAFRLITTQCKYKRIYNYEACERIFMTYGYRYKPIFLDEYIMTMRAIKNVEYCFDLMVINDFICSAAKTDIIPYLKNT